MSGVFPNSVGARVAGDAPSAMIARKARSYRQASTTLTNCLFFGPFFSNFTCPSFLANRV